MTDLLWTIDEDLFTRQGIDKWVIHDTNRTICYSYDRETLEVILEVVDALQAMIEDYECECGPDHQCSRCRGVIMLEAARQGKRHWLGRVEGE